MFSNLLLGSKRALSMRCILRSIWQGISVCQLHWIILLNSYIHTVRKKSKEKSDEENKVTAEFKIQSGNAKIPVDPEIIGKKQFSPVTLTHSLLMIHQHNWKNKFQVDSLNWKHLISDNSIATNVSQGQLQVLKCSHYISIPTNV